MVQKQKNKATSLVKPPNSAPFPYADYCQVKETLEGALMHQCFYALLSGKSGVGKTSLLRELNQGLDRHRHLILYITSSHASVTGIARVLAMKLHVTPRRSFLENVFILNEAIHAQTSHLVIWLDEADRMDTGTMSELRMLAESDLSHNQSFSIVLSGLPSIVSLLETPDLFPLKRRITHRLTLTGLRRDEFEAFCEHRFGDEALKIPRSINDELFERTQGIPAVIDQVIFLALSKTNGNKGEIDAQKIRIICDSLGL